MTNQLEQKALDWLSIKQFIDVLERIPKHNPHYSQQVQELYDKVIKYHHNYGERFSVMKPPFEVKRLKTEGVGY